MQTRNRNLLFGSILTALFLGFIYVFTTPGLAGRVMGIGSGTGRIESTEAPDTGENPRQTPTKAAEIAIAPTAFLAPATLTPFPTMTEFFEMTPVPPETDASGVTSVPGLEITSGMVPLMDMINGETYKGFPGGLYPGGSNDLPAAHFEEGMKRAGWIQPLDVNGKPSPDGKIILLVVGMSNTDLEACGVGQIVGSCPPYTFIGRANADPDVNHNTLFIFDGARGSLDAKHWVGTDADIYDWIDMNFAKLGLSRLQVQAAWIKEANMQPSVALPSSNADAYELMAFEGEIVRTLKEQYPNLQQVFLSSRIYAGYSQIKLNPEPYAYETGFAVKWLIEAQIDQMAGVFSDLYSIAGDLDYDTAAPWLAWGPYLWANGTEPRSDGLTYVLEDFRDDLTHPSESGAAKVGELLLEFFKDEPYTQCWFLAGGAC